MVYKTISRETWHLVLLLLSVIYRKYTNELVAASMIERGYEGDIQYDIAKNDKKLKNPIVDPLEWLPSSHRLNEYSGSRSIGSSYYCYRRLPVPCESQSTVPVAAVRGSH